MTDQSLLTPGSAEDQRTPPYQTSASVPSSHSSQAATSSATSKGSLGNHHHEVFQTQKGQVESYREKVTERRAQLRESREELRVGRGDLCELQNRLQRALQQYSEGQAGPDKASLNNLRQETEQALERLGQAEISYNEAEDDLRLLEFKLGAHETLFYSHSRPFEPNQRAEPAALGSSSRSSSLHSVLSPKDGEDIPAITRYRIRQAEARIASTQLQELEDEKAELLELEKNHRFPNPPLDPADTEFLANYDVLYQQQYDELEALRRDLIILRREAGSSKSSRSEKTKSQTDKVSTPGTPHSDPGIKAKDSPRTPTAPRRKSDGIDMPIDIRSTRQRVNRWLIEVLNASPIQRRMSEEFLQDPELSNTTWWRFLLQFRRIDSLLRLNDNIPPFSTHAYYSDGSGVGSPAKDKLSDASPDMLLPPVDPHLHRRQGLEFGDGERYSYSARSNSFDAVYANRKTRSLPTPIHGDSYVFFNKPSSTSRY